MVTKIIFSDEYHESRKMFFKETSFETFPDKRIIPLFGPNGAGKTTFLSAVSATLSMNQSLNRLVGTAKDDGEKDFYIRDIGRSLLKEGCIVETDSDAYKLLSYSNSDDNFRHRRERSMYDAFDPFLINARFDANSISEGQSIIYSVLGLFDAIKDYDGNDDLIVCVDELDSGLSIDNIDKMMRKIKNILKTKENIQIFLSFNNPRVLKAFPYVLSMYDGKMYEMHTDEDMLSEIKRNQKWFDKKRRKSDGSPKVYD